MKRSEVVKLIAEILANNNTPSTTAEEIMHKLETEVRMLPPKRDYIEHYQWKSDNKWEKE